MASIITVKGIDQAISNLNYRNKNALKYRLVNIIRQFYENESSVESMQGIASDELVKVLWNIGDDPATIKKKRKNLSSIKSSINANLKKLYKEGKNPDGIIIGRTNIFVMSDEAKDKVLKSLKNRITDEGTATLGQIADTLNIVNEILSNPEAIADAEGAEGLSNLDKLKNLIQGLSEKVGLGGSEPTDSASEVSKAISGESETTGSSGIAEVIEDVEIDEAIEEKPEEVEVDDELEEPEIYEHLEELETDDDLEEVEMVVEPEELERLTDEAKSEESLEQAEARKGLKEVDLVKGAGGAGLQTGDSGQGYAEGRYKDEGEIGDKPELEEALREVGATYDLVRTKDIIALGDKEKTGGPYRAEAKEGGGGLKEIVGDGTGTVEKADLILNIVNEILSKPESFEGTEGAEVLSNLDKLKNLIHSLSEKVGLGGSEPTDSASEVSKAISGESETTGSSGIAEVIEHYEDVEEIVEDDEIDEETEPLEEVVPEEGRRLDETQEAEEIEILDKDETIEDILGVKIDEATEEAETEEDLEEIDEVEETEEADLLADSSGEEYPDGGYGEEDEIKKARLLAEEFNSSLAAMDKFYNQYIFIQEGEYIVGSKRPKKDEKPEQVVHLSPFYIGKFPITNALFEIFVEKTGYRTTAEKLGYGIVYYGRSRKTIDKKTGLKRFIWNSTLISKTVKGACWYQPMGPGSTLYNKKNHPVVQVSLEDAIAFAAWAGKRLPTEDEWEAASRTANGYVFPWGNDWKKDSCNIEESSIGDTTPVDKYIEFASDFGIVDTIGNVVEWTSDTSEPPSYIKNISKFYIIKGGSWISGNGIRLFSRFKLEPESHSNILGFRCVAY